MDRAVFQHGIELFNQGKFFDAHEVWEDVWRAARAEEKKFLQGLIQVAVALHHDSRDNLEGAQSLLARAQRNLSEYPDCYHQVDLARLRQQIAACERALAEGLPGQLRIDLRIAS